VCVSLTLSICRPLQAGTGLLLVHRTDTRGLQLAAGKGKLASPSF
jgi:hypothetical protein